jgi:hypothetical protein
MRALLIFWLVFCCGCTRRPASPGGLTFFVGIECHPSAEMIDCNQVSPPSCRLIALSFDKGCEQLQANRTPTVHQ